MRNTVSLLATALCLALSQVEHMETANAIPTAQARGAFSFALLGDLPYGDTQVTQFDAVIEEVNADKSLQFVMHTGDVKGGSERCDDDRLIARFNQFQKFVPAFIFTPGDNDWTDCHRTNNGSFNPIERLGFLRSVFYSVPNRSTGQNPIRVRAQSGVSGYEQYVENSIFIRNRVVFSTLHIVGSNNNLEPWTGLDSTDSYLTPRADRQAEFQARQAATLQWLNQTFDTAEANGAAGVFIMIQANPRFDLASTDQQRAGFNAFLDQLRLRTQQYNKPVILAHGDFHEYLIDKPFDTEKSTPRLPKFTRIQAFGSPRVHWVKVNVNPDAAPVFSFQEKLVERNLE
jgi:hypothetical protein